MTLAKVFVGALILVIDACKQSRSQVAPHELPQTGSVTPVELRSEDLGAGSEQGQNQGGGQSQNSGPTMPAKLLVKKGDKHVPSMHQTLLHETLPAASFLGFALVARGEIGVSDKGSGPESESIRGTDLSKFPGSPRHLGLTLAGTRLASDIQRCAGRTSCCRWWRFARARHRGVPCQVSRYWVW